jgi:hypothetical protein
MRRVVGFAAALLLMSWLTIAITIDGRLAFTRVPAAEALEARLLTQRT